MFAHNIYQPLESIFSDESNNSINLNLIFNSETKQDIFNFNELKCNFNENSIRKKEETKATLIDHSDSNNYSEKKQIKPNLFSIEKIPRGSNHLKSTVRQSKRINSHHYKRLNEDAKIDKEKIWKIIDDEVYPSKTNLTIREKAYLKKIKNRITAQNSRDKMKYHFELLQKTNESLNKGLSEKDEKINALTNIVSSCSFCSDKAETVALIPKTNNTKNVLPSFNTITQTDNGLSFLSRKCFSVGFASIVAIICSLFLLFSFKTGSYKNIIRTLIGTEEEDNYLKIRYAQNNTQCCSEEIGSNSQSRSERNYFLTNMQNDIAINKQIEPPLIKQKTLKTQNSNSFLCKEYISAKLSNELNFDLIYNEKKNNLSLITIDNKNASRFKMIIPSFTYQNDFKPFIISMSSQDYLNQFAKLTQYAYYEVICQITKITKVTGPN